MPTFRQIAPATWALFWRSQTPTILFLAANVWVSTTLSYKLMLARWFLLLFEVTSALGISMIAGYYIVLALSFTVGLVGGFLIFSAVLNGLLRAGKWPISLTPEGEGDIRSFLRVSWYLFWRSIFFTMVAGFLCGLVIGFVLGIAKGISGANGQTLFVVATGSIWVFGLAVSFWVLSKVLRHSLYRPIDGKVLMFRGIEPPARWHYWAETQ